MSNAPLAGVEGVEPSLTEPESAVLPLDDTPVGQQTLAARSCILRNRELCVKAMIAKFLYIVGNGCFAVAACGFMTSTASREDIEACSQYAANTP